MADKFTKEKRSEIMSRIRSKDTKIEILLRKELWKLGFRYLKNSHKYFGTPDIVLPKYKTVIFVDSCFWHGCKKHGTTPKTRKSYWESKILRNKERDVNVSKLYKKEKWMIVRVWEHDLKNKTVPIVAGKIKAKVEKLP